MRKLLFVFLFCSVIGASLGYYKVTKQWSPENELHAIVLQTKNGSKLFERSSSLLIIEKILKQNIKVQIVSDIDQLKNKLLADRGDSIDFVVLDLKTFKQTTSDSLLGSWSEFFEDILSNDIIAKRNSGENQFLPITWANSSVLKQFSKCAPETKATDTKMETKGNIKKDIKNSLRDISDAKNDNKDKAIPFFVEGLAIPEKLSQEKKEKLSKSIRKLLVHPAFQKILSQLPHGIAINDDAIHESIQNLIPKEKRVTQLQFIPLSER